MTAIFQTNLAVVVTKFPNLYQIVMEIGYDSTTRDRETREEHTTRCSRDMQGSTGSADYNLHSGGVEIGAGGTRCQIEVTRSGVGNGSGRFL